MFLVSGFQRVSSCCCLPSIFTGTVNRLNITIRMNVSIYVVPRHPASHVFLGDIIVLVIPSMSYVCSYIDLRFSIVPMFLPAVVSSQFSQVQLTDLIIVLE